jgi:hypothetical protein
MYIYIYLIEFGFVYNLKISIDINYYLFKISFIILKFNDKHFNIQNGLDENENSLNGLVILQDITIQNICNVNFKK